MTQTIDVYAITCSGCAGTGIMPLHPAGSQTCPMCDGGGKQIVRRFELDPGLDDIMDKLNDIKEKVDEIKKKVDTL